MGDAFEVIYKLRREPDAAQRMIADPDNDGLSNLEEFKWGTLPILNTTVDIAGVATYVRLDWADDSDDDGLSDGEEKAYWNNYWNDSELFKEAFASLVDKTAVRDPDSLLDLDGDACDVEGNPHVSYIGNETGIDPNAWRFQGCSHVADDPDSDNDGLLDGEETAPGSGLGQWISDTDWRGGAFPWAVDSDCRVDYDPSPDNEVSCEDIGNYWNITRQENGYKVFTLSPGSGDGLPDLLERNWWVNLSQSTQEVWNPMLGANQGIWKYHRDRGGWSLSDANGEQNTPPEIDFDTDAAMPLLDIDSDNDGYTDLAEYLTHHPDYAIPTYVWSLDGNGSSEYESESDWRNENVPSCGAVGLLPYTPDADYDGLSDKQECGTTKADADGTTQGTDPWAWDTDGDGMPDGWETQFSSLDPLTPDGELDPDNDTLSNFEEYCYRPDTELFSPDGAQWGCDLSNPQAYWDWNPCALDPERNDTDEDGLNDDEDSHASSKLNLETGCPDGTGQRVDSWTAGVGAQLNPNQDLSEYDPTLVDHVRNDLYNASSKVIGEELSAQDLIMEAQSRSEQIVQAQIDTLDGVLQNTTPLIFDQPLLRQFTETVDNTPKVVDPLVGEVTNTGEDTLALVNALDEPLEAIRAADLVGTLEPVTTLAEGALESAAQATEDPGRFVDRVVTNATSDLTQVVRKQTSAAVDQPLFASDPTTLDPLEVLKTESVIPDFTFSLLDDLDASGTKAIWDAYVEHRNTQAEHLVDTSHYKAFAADDTGWTNVTRNIALGDRFAWDIDGSDMTGADVPGTWIDPACAPTDLLCPVDYERGDDIIVNVSAQPATEENPVRPTLWIAKLDASEALPWFIAAFMLPHVEQGGSQLPVGASGEPPEGYVAYLGVDGRPDVGFPAGDVSDLAMDRSYNIEDIPDKLHVGLLDYGLITDGAVPDQTVVDPANHLSLKAGFHDDRVDYDTRLAAGIFQYKLNDTQGKEIFQRGNATNASLLFRGTPSSLRVDYDINNETRGIPGGVRYTDAARITWTAERPQGAEDRGAELSVNRTANYNGRRPSVSLGTVTSSLPTGTYAKETTRTELDENGESVNDKTELHHLALASPIDEAYLRLERRTNLSASAIPSHGTRVWIDDVPTSVRMRTDSRNATHEAWADQAVGSLRVLNGPNDDACPDLSSHANYITFLASTAEKHGCLASRLVGFQTITAQLADPDVPGGQLALNYQRDAALVDQTLSLDSPDDAALYLEDDHWFTVEASDLPDSLDIELGRPGSDGDLVRLDYAFTPVDESIDELHLRGELNIEGSSEPADLELRLQGLPSQGSGTFSKTDKTVDLSFSDRVTAATFRYVEPDSVAQLPGRHVLLADGDEGVSITGNIQGLKSFHLDASRDDNLTMEADILSNAETLIHVATPAATGSSIPNAFDLGISNLPGPMRFYWDRPNQDTWELHTNMAAPITKAWLTGDLSETNFDLVIESIERAHATYEQSDLPSADPLKPGRGVHFQVDSSQPLSIRGRVVDLTGSLDPSQPWPAAPGWAENHVIHVEEADGTSTLSLNVTNLNAGDLTYRDLGGEGFTHRVFANATLTGGARAFHLRSEQKATGQPPTMAYLNLSDLPETLTLSARQGNLSYSASHGIDLVELFFRDPDVATSVQGRLKSLPTGLNAVWDSSAGHGATVEVAHNGLQPVAEAYLEYEDRDALDPTYLYVLAQSIPKTITAEANTSPLVLDLQVEDGTGTPAHAGLVDVRFHSNAPSITVPCPDGDCHGYEMVTGDFRSDHPTWFAIRADGLKDLSAKLVEANQGPGRLSYNKTDEHKTFLSLFSDKANLEGNLTPLPATGRLGYEVRKNATTETLDALQLSWSGSSEIADGNLSIQLAPTGGGNPQRLVTEFAGFSDVLADWEGGILDVTSKGGVDALRLLQYGPVQQEVEKPFRQPRLENSHYAMFDNQTLSDESLIWARAWGLSRLTVDPAQGLFNLSLTPGAPLRPVEAWINADVLEGQLELGDLPRWVEATWNPAPSQAGGWFTYDAAGTIDRVDLDLTKRSNITDPSSGQKTRLEHLLRASIDDIPPHLEADWRDGFAEITTGGTGAVGSAEILLQNITGDHGEAKPMPVKDSFEGFYWINSTSDDVVGSNSGIDPRLRQVTAHLSGLESITASWSEAAVEMTLQRDDTLVGSHPAVVVYANGDTYLETQLDQLPADFIPLTVELTDETHVVARTDANLRTTQGMELSATASAAIGGGNITLRQLDDTGSSSQVGRDVRANLSALPVEVAFAYENTEYVTATGTVDGYQRLSYEGDAAGAGIEATVVDHGDRIAATMEGLPTVLQSNLTYDRRDGWISTGPGEMGLLDLVVKPEDYTPYTKLDDAEEGLVASQTDRNVAHVRFTALDEAWWNLTGTGLQAGDHLLHIKHGAPTKPVRIGIIKADQGGEQEVISAKTSDLPDDWTLTLAGDKTNLSLTYHAAELLSDLWVDWRKGGEHLTATLSDVGTGWTNASYDFAGHYRIDLTADAPASWLNVTALLDRNFTQARLGDLPERLVVNVTQDFRAGTVKATNADSTAADPLGTVDLFHSPCLSFNQDGTCDGAPPRFTKENFPDTDGILRHEQRSSTSTFAYFEGLSEATWSLGQADAPDWHTVRLTRNASMPASTAKVVVLGLGDTPDVEYDIDVQALPSELTFLLHQPNASWAADTGLPEGFALPPSFPAGGSVHAGDTFASFEFPEGEPDPTMRVVTRFPGLLLAVPEARGLSPGYVHVWTEEEGIPISLFNGTMAFKSGLDEVRLLLQNDPLQRDPSASEDSPLALPYYINVTAMDLPPRVDLHAWKYGPTTVDADGTVRECDLGSTCTARFGVETGDGVIGSLRAWIHANSSSAKQVTPSSPAQEYEAGNLDTPAEENVHVHVGRDSFTGEGTAEEDRRDLQVSLNLTNVSTAYAHFDGANIRGHVEVPASKDLDVLVTWPATAEEREESPDKTYRHLDTRVRGLEGTLDFRKYHPGGDPGATAFEASLAPPPGATTLTPIDLGLHGDLSFDALGHKVRTFHLEALDVENSFDLSWTHENSGHAVTVNTGEIHSITGFLELLPDPATHDPEACAGGDAGGGQGTPFTLRVNSDDTGTYTNGHIGLLDLAMSTPTTAAESKVPNHVMLTCSTGVGMDERGLAVQLHDIEQVDLDIQPVQGSDEHVTHLITQFTDHQLLESTSPREMEFRSVENGEITRATSSKWPDQTTIHVEKASIKEAVGERSIDELFSTWVEATGVAPGCVFTYPNVGDIPCWSLHITFPLFEPPAQGKAHIWLVSFEGQRNAVDFKQWGTAVGSWLLLKGIDATEGAAKAVVELTSETANTITRIAARGANWVGEFDLDGVGAWDGEVPFFNDGKGPSFAIEHGGPDYGHSLESGTGSFDGTSVWLDEELVNKSRPDGPTRKVYKRGGDHNHASDPKAYIQAPVDGRQTRFMPPSCIWDEEGCVS